MKTEHETKYIGARVPTNLYVRLTDQVDGLRYRSMGHVIEAALTAYLDMLEEAADALEN